MSERRRHGFPKVGHYDTWLIDLLQLLVEDNHQVLEYPTWPNTADYADTTETFDIVPIHSAQLGEKFQTITLEPTVVKKFTSDQKYLFRCMGTPAPLLPVHGEDEFRLFDRLVRKHARLDFDAMALEWCDEVNGVTIFPKLPIYLRTHHAVWQRNERARQAVETAAAGEVELARINAETLQQLIPAAAQAAAAGTVSPAVVGPMAAAPTAAAPAATAAAG